MATPFRLTDSQLQLLLAAAKPLDPDKRGLFLERVGAHLRCNGSGHQAMPTSRPPWQRGSVACSSRHGRTMPPETVGTVIAMVLVARSTARETVPEPYAVRPLERFWRLGKGWP
jgi:hypothetical protein